MQISQIIPQFPSETALSGVAALFFPAQSLF
jgi:hypothetical protein